MFDFKEIFKDKKITQIGLGLLGRGVGDADFLARNGAELILTDLKTEEELKSSVDKLKKYKNVTFHLGGHRIEDFVDRDLILKGAGVPFNLSHILEARKNNIPVDMSASLLFRIAKMPIIGITGTRGKSTVTHMLHEMLIADGRDVILGGNVKGVSNLKLLESVKSSSVGVFELDSWQCQGLAEEQTLNAKGVEQGVRSPELAVFTIFMPDHLNYYKGDVDAYLADKANIFLYQNSSDVLVIGKQALTALEKYKKDIKSNVIIAGEDDVPKKWNIKLVGEHNRYNVGIAVSVARAFGVDDDVIRHVVENTKALKGRLEFVKTVKGVDVYNDTNSTTPEALEVALKSFTDKNIILIAGGADKDLDTSSLLQTIKKYAKDVMFLNGTGTEKMLKDDGDYKVFGSLEDAFNSAMKVAKEGDVLLFSPGFASFGMFKNEFDRGEQFVELVENC